MMGKCIHRRFTWHWSLSLTFAIKNRFLSPHDSAAVCVLYIDRIHFKLVCPKKTLNKMLITVRHYGLLKGGLLTPQMLTDPSGEFGDDVNVTGASVAGGLGYINSTPTEPILEMAKALQAISQAISNSRDSQSFSNLSNISLFGDDITSQITLSPTKSSYQYYLKNETFEEISYDVYREVDAYFHCFITRSDLEGKVFVAQREGSLVSMKLRVSVQGHGSKN